MVLSLVEFPFEIIVQIINQIDDIIDIVNFSKSCVQFLNSFTIFFDSKKLNKTGQFLKFLKDYSEINPKLKVSRTKTLFQDSSFSSVSLVFYKNSDNSIFCYNLIPLNTNDFTILLFEEHEFEHVFYSCYHCFIHSDYINTICYIFDKYFYCTTQSGLVCKLNQNVIKNNIRTVLNIQTILDDCFFGCASTFSDNFDHYFYDNVTYNEILIKKNNFFLCSFRILKIDNRRNIHFVCTHNSITIYFILHQNSLQVQPICQFDTCLKILKIDATENNFVAIAHDHCTYERISSSPISTDPKFDKMSFKINKLSQS